MQTIIRAVVPQPILADDKPPGRWIWAPEEPIRDHRFEGTKLVDRGTYAVSWWNIDGEVDMSETKYCPVERPEKSKVMMVFDGERWVWHITFTEAQAKKWKKEK